MRPARGGRRAAMATPTHRWLLALAMAVLLAAPSLSLANCPNGCQCDDDTLVVTCGEGTLDVLPIALNPSIQRLVIKNNRIKTIDSSMQFYAELTFLDLSSNHLMVIPQRTFAYQRKLHELHLNNNKVGHVSNKTFQGLAALAVLNLRGNLLAELEAGTFAPTPRLEELNLGQNRISRIDAHAFDGLASLRVLYLDDNTLTMVPPEAAFRALPSLAELFLGTNSFTTLPGGAFRSLQGLTRLDLRGAGLHNLSREALQGLEGVRFLDLADNRLPAVPTAALGQLERLEELALGQNDFELVAAGAFAGLKNLRRLEVTGAQRLRRVESGAFAANANLEHLDLSANKLLAEVEAGALSGLPHLRHVLLRENQLRTLAEGLFPWADLQSLDLSDNPIECDCRVLWLRNLLVSKNGSHEAVADVVCAAPDRLREASLRSLTPAALGCAHHDPHQKTMIGVFVVCSVATLTALTIVVYRCRRRIRDVLKCSWGNSALGRKEREYQKTFSDEEFVARQQHPCSLGGLHAGGFPSAFPPAQAPLQMQMQTQYLGSRPIPVTEL